MLYEWPTRTAFDRIIPKRRVWEASTRPAKLKKLLTESVDQLRWAHKLSPHTLNLPAGQNLQEIQVIRIVLKAGHAQLAGNERLLMGIERAIPHPLLLEIERSVDDGGGFRMAAAWRRRAENRGDDPASWVIASHVFSEWISDATPRQALPVATDLGQLYRQILQSLMPLPPRTGETMVQLSQRVNDHAVLTKQVEFVEGRLRREPQFNKKVELNRELRELKARLNGLETMK